MPLLASPDESAFERRLRRLPFFFHGLFWAVICCAVAVLAAMSNSEEPLLAALGGAALGVIGFVLSSIALWLLPHPPQSRTLIFTILSITISWFLLVELLDNEQDPLEDLIGTAVFLLFLTTFWLTFVLYARHTAALFHTQQARQAAEQDHRDAQLQLLQSQIKPHFLFNALNTLQSKISESPPQAERLVELLAELLRDSFEDSASPTIRAERSRLEKYVEIQRQRFEETLNIEMRFDPELDDQYCPPFLFQPLVENAIRHGGRDAQGVQQVSLNVEAAGAHIHCRVWNHGRVSPSERPGTGLANIRSRLDALFGADASFKLDEENGRVCASLTVPRQAAPQ